MKEILKKLFIIILIVGNIILGILYTRVSTQYEMYKQFTEVQSGKITLQEAPNELPVIK